MKEVRCFSRHRRCLVFGTLLPMTMAIAHGDADRFNYILGTHTIEAD